jgi:hypothetical protein
MMKSLLVRTQTSYRFAFLDYVLPAILGNMFIFLIAGHEVGLSFFSGRMVAKAFPTDYSPYALLHIWLVGALSG